MTRQEIVQLLEERIRLVDRTLREDEVIEDPVLVVLFREEAVAILALLRQEPENRGLRLPPATELRVRHLHALAQAGRLTPEEHFELHQFTVIDHQLRTIQARARQLYTEELPK
jgi:hypothetical protein